MDDRTLFDEVFEQALGENPDVLMEKHAAAIARGDWERVRLLDECLRVAAIRHARSRSATSAAPEQLASGVRPEAGWP
jgi:hypothetical protein